MLVEYAGCEAVYAVTSEVLQALKRAILCATEYHNIHRRILRYHKLLAVLDGL
jgi:hypothetical protein